MIYQELRIGQHPQRNEEEGGKDVPHRDDLGERPLSRPIRLAQDESGEERAKSGGEPCPFGKRGSGESCCNDRDDERLARANEGDPFQDSGCGKSADEQYRAKNERCL